MNIKKRVAPRRDEPDGELSRAKKTRIAETSTQHDIPSDVLSTANDLRRLVIFHQNDAQGLVDSPFLQFGA